MSSPSPAATKATLAVQRAADATRFVLGGRLATDTIAEVWQQGRRALHHATSRLEIDTSAVDLSSTSQLLPRPGRAKRINCGNITR